MRDEVKALLRRAARAAVRVAVALSVGGAPAWAAKSDMEATHGIVRREDLEIVDCLLPGQVRQLGNMTYLTARRPTHTTASDCRIRGGEYVAYDRADLKSALAVWLQAAQAGDAEAQTNVAEIYERGLGVAPNYEAAVMWYQKAADQKYSRALFNLGTLYEQGLGVEQDKLKALNLYRQAWGLPEDSVMYQSAAREQNEALRAELEKQLAEKDEQLKLLQHQLDTLQKELASHPAPPAANATPGTGTGANPDAKSDKSDARSEIEALKKWIAQLESERAANNSRLASLPQLRTPAAIATLPTISAQADVRSVGNLNFGRYYALVIGNQHYQLIESLKTPVNDAERAARVLRERYGFTVQVLEDSSDVAMLKALNDLNDVLKPDDNLLIYYAGHGARLQTTYVTAGYWLPINSEAPPKDTFWVPNEQITAHLARLNAKRVLVVADSCYAGLLSTDPSYLFAGSSGGYSKDYIAYKLPKRSRLLISSGGDEPVLDTGGGENSVFANAFITELELNQGILPAPELYSRISKRVETGAQQNKFVQKPEFKSIKGAGHEVGDFFFVPKDLK
ncbi:MAG TPA: caspase family protein [Steroidobacteraceae bacterium]|nr:caspase family protein [Steroidobacteraceae bacterium]